MKLIKQLVIVAVVLLAVGSFATLGVVLRSNPMDAVRAAAVEAGYDAEELQTLGGGYSSQWLRWKAYGEFRLQGESQDEVLYVEVVKPNPLGSWSLSEIRRQEPR